MYSLNSPAEQFPLFRYVSIFKGLKNIIPLLLLQHIYEQIT